MGSQKEMFFCIADISGYTSYMLANQMDHNHAKLSITTLMKSLIKKTSLPLEVSKLEGDAVFLYMQKPHKEPLWLGQKMLTFFQAFDEKILELKESNICTCGACKNIEKLNLKIIVHYGKASIDKIGNFKELAGVDVIIAHRLLKNHIMEKRYLLITDAAYQNMPLRADLPVSKSEEIYEDIGTIPVNIAYPPSVAAEAVPDYSTFLFKIKRFLVLHIQDLFLKMGLMRKRNFKHLPNQEKEHA